MRLGTVRARMAPAAGLARRRATQLARRPRAFSRVYFTGRLRSESRTWVRTPLVPHRSGFRPCLLPWAGLLRQ